MTKQQVILIHGGETFNSYESYIKNLQEETVDLSDLKNRTNWRSTLSESLGEGFDVLAPNMPNKQNAKYLEWKIWFGKIALLIEDGAILIGHSLGATFLAKYLSEENLPKKIGGLLLVSPPFDDADFEDSLADFALSGDLQKLTDQVEKIFIYYSKDDPISPFTELSKFQKALPEAKSVIFEDRGHFLQEEFPEIVEEIRKLREMAG